MKKTKSLFAFFILAASALLLIGWHSYESRPDKNKDDNIIVILKFKAQTDKGDHTVSELTKLIEKVKKEPNFVSIKLHVDPKDKTNILLYEEWEDQSYYNTEHMNTDYIKEFMTNSRNFLTGPPEITFWSVEKIFK